MAPSPHVDHQEGGRALAPNVIKSYNVMSYLDLFWLCLGTGPLACFCWPYRRTLVLATDEVTLEEMSVCCTSKKRVPYGELSGVDIVNCCGCASFGGGALGGNITPGCGCQTALVGEIVGTLKERQRQRGDIAQLQRTEQALDRVAALELHAGNMDAKLDALLAHLKVPPPARVTAAPAAQQMM
jgi:hypothetical protein